MILGHRRRDDKLARVAHVFGTVTHCDLDAECFEIVERAGMRVTASDWNSATRQQFGESSHSRAGDSDEVDRPRVGAIDRRHRVVDQRWGC